VLIYYKISRKISLIVNLLTFNIVYI